MRAFLTRQAGVGTKQDPWRPDVTMANYPGVQFACWDIEHPDTDAVIGYIVVWTGNTAPIEAIADLGDPTDRVSMRSVTLGTTAATAILDLVYGVGNYTQSAVNAAANRTGVQTIRFLNRTQPVMAASWGTTVADLVDATD